MEIVSLAISKDKGTRKKVVNKAHLKKDHGIVGDAHAGQWHRQISFLSSEEIEKTRERGIKIGFGDFAENIATKGIDWGKIPIGTKIQLGKSAIVEITQIGKKCHKKCAIYYQIGDCIMPRKGIFGRVMQEGMVYVGDKLKILAPKNKN